MERNRIESLLQTLPGKRFVCVGDVMLDRFVHGNADRLSPEAPVPVLKLFREVSMPGGAGNVARNLAALGAPVSLHAVIGDDAASHQLAKVLQDEEGVASDLLVIGNRVTTVKTRFMAAGQQLLRVDTETSDALAPLPRSALLEAVTQSVDGAAALLLSDYAKGVLCDGVLGEIAALPKRPFTIVDPKRADWRAYGAVDVIKPNAKELREATGMPVGTDEEVARALKSALADCEATTVVVTRAGAGMSALSRGGDVIHRKGERRAVYDVSGAGDTAMAALAAALCQGVALALALDFAILASGKAVEKAGTAAISSSELLSPAEPGMGRGALSAGDAAALSRKWREAGLSVGFTNGCFDLIHPGHVHVLAEAAKLCDRLVVGLNSDSSVSRLKGASRPVTPQDSRAVVLSALSSVDAVVVFEEDTPAALIEAVKPDVLVKGGDYSRDTIVGADFVESLGGSVHVVELISGHSTSRTVEKMSRQPA